MISTKYPLLYQINTRVLLTEISRKLGRCATLDDIPDEELDAIAEPGFDMVWLLSVWQTGKEALRISRTNTEWLREFRETLPDLREEDIGGSGFAITDYTVNRDLGGDDALARLRERLRARGLQLMLDFVPNHTAPDHRWVDEHPEYYVAGTEMKRIQHPGNYVWLKRPKGDLLLAHGRDPYFPGWPDTVQLNYGNKCTQEAMKEVLIKIAGQCDGVRCDMAMLVLPEVFQRTWGVRAEPFWPMATARVRERYPEFIFMAEVYWDMEWTMQQQGFDYAYDKRLYDRLREGHARPVRDHLSADLKYQNKLARFLENHDEPRAAATFSNAMHKAAAVVTFLSPGMRFFHQGEFEGKTKRISPHLVRGPEERVDGDLRHFYQNLLGALRHTVVRKGQWQLLGCTPAWEGNWSSDAFIAYQWSHQTGEPILVCVNYSDHASQCYLRIALTGLEGRQWQLTDLLSDACYGRDGNELVSKGLFLDLAAWSYHVFTLRQG